MDPSDSSKTKHGPACGLVLARGSAFYDNVPHPPLSKRAIKAAALIETRSGDEGENYRRWVAIQIDEARQDDSDAALRAKAGACAQSLRRYAAECFPEITNGRRHFVRALMESWADDLDAVLSSPNS